MKLNDIIFKRESLTLPIDGNDETWDYLTLYDENDKVIARSGRNHFEGTIYLRHEGFDIIATPASIRNGESDIFITVASIRENLKKTNDN